MHKQGLKASGFEMQWRTGPPNAGTEAKGQGKSQKAVMRWRQVSHIPSSNAVSASGGVVVIKKEPCSICSRLAFCIPCKTVPLAPIF